MDFAADQTTLAGHRLTVAYSQTIRRREIRRATVRRRLRINAVETVLRRNISNRMMIARRPAMMNVVDRLRPNFSAALKGVDDQVPMGRIQMARPRSIPTPIADPTKVRPGGHRGDNHKMVDRCRRNKFAECSLCRCRS